VGHLSPHASAVAQAYDDASVRYAEFIWNGPGLIPLERALLAAFAEHVRASSTGPAAGAEPAAGRGPRLVADLGCGPGYLTVHLRDLGLDAFGVDLSPATIELARAANPGLRLETGSMDALDLADGTLGGIISWYSVIHADPAELPGYFAEFRRVLAPGGYLLLAFFESGGGPVAVFDHKVTPAFLWPADDLAALARAAGFAEDGRMLREPGEDERFRRGHLLLHLT
jgi:SAM-dependent methyltransferase